MSDRRLKDAFRRGAVPDEAEARDRVWSVVREAYAAREPVSWPVRHARTLVLAGAAAVVAAAIAATAISPPGRAVLRSLRKAVGTERVERAKPLTSLPGGGRLLVSSAGATWVVYANGSRRRLGPYNGASWSPHGLFAAGTRGHDLVAFEPQRGTVRWVISRPGLHRSPVWAPDGYRIAYLAGSSLRVAVGDGSDDREIAPAVSPVAPAWRPLPIHEPAGSRHVLAFVGVRGWIDVVDTDTRARLWRRAIEDPVRSLAWSDDGRLLLVVTRNALYVFGGNGGTIAVSRPRGVLLSAAVAPHSHVVAFAVASLHGSEVFRAVADRLPSGARQVFRGAGRIRELAWSPDATWLLAGWQSADQWLFIRSAPVQKLVTVSDVSGIFGTQGAFPALSGWCCPS